MPSKLELFFARPIKRAANGREYPLSSTSLNFHEARQLQQLIKDTRAEQVAEVGLALGASAVAIAEALEERHDGSRLVTLDPFQSAFGNVGLSELDRLELKNRVEFVASFGEEFFLASAKAQRYFDFIFIDGAHSIGEKVTTTYFADRCLKSNGTLAFHDAFMPSTIASVKYLVFEQSYRVVSLPPDSTLKRWSRVLRHSTSAGYWYSCNITPYTHGSLVALRKPVKGT